jgi:glycosyltransferase involved in cell wall biosynthesis
LDSLVNQSFPREHYEIIVVDNGSTDKTLDVARKFSNNYPQLVSYVVEEKHHGSYAARNRGITESVGKIISFLDSNIITKNNFISQIIKYFENNSVDYLGNRVETNIIKDTLSARYNKMNDFQIKTNIRYNHYTPTCCLAIRRSVIDKVGVFDGRLESGGDWDYGQRIYKANLKQEYIDDIVVFHPARFSYKSLINKGRRVARGISQLAYYMPEEYSYLFNNYFGIRRYFPYSPVKLYREYKQKFDDTTYFQGFIYAFFHIPIRVISLFELINEKIRLNLKKK